MTPTAVSSSVAPGALEPALLAAAGVITFPLGVPGFEHCRRFVIATSPDIAPLVWLNGLDAPSPSFLAIDPARVTPVYAVPFSSTDRERLEAAPGEPLLWLAVVRVDGDRASVNLQAPIVVNPRRMLGLQVVTSDIAYPPDHPLLED